MRVTYSRIDLIAPIADCCYPQQLLPQTRQAESLANRSPVFQRAAKFNYGKAASGKAANRHAWLLSVPFVPIAAGPHRHHHLHASSHCVCVIVYFWNRWNSYRIISGHLAESVD
jgi:hypothetical protein